MLDSGTRSFDPNIMLARLAAYCVPSLGAARPYKPTGIIRMIGKVFHSPEDVFIVVSPEVHIVVKIMSLIVNLFVTCEVESQMVVERDAFMGLYKKDL